MSVTGLAPGSHTVKLVKAGGDYLVVDGFVVIPDRMAPVHDITFRGVTFAHTTWNLPSTVGYIDNQAGVLWDAATRRSIRIPAAVQVHRGRDIVFTDVEIAHTGGTGIDLADGTRDSTVTRSWIHDTSGGGVSLGEVDDYYVTDPARMTSDDTISQNVIEYVGQDYQDAVGIWAGYTRGATLANNEIAHTPYSGISLGWGWGWAASCELQAKQGNFPVSSCRHGTIYAGDNKIVENYVYDVMGVLHDGGHIYTNGGQGGHDDTLTSEFRGNVLSGGTHTNNMIYQDEGSSNWDTHHNVIHFANGSWTGMWTPTIHDIRMHDNFYAPAGSYNNGTNVVLTNNTEVTRRRLAAGRPGDHRRRRPAPRTAGEPDPPRRLRPVHRLPRVVDRPRVPRPRRLPRDRARRAQQRRLGHHDVHRHRRQRDRGEELRPGRHRGVPRRRVQGS